MTSTTTGTPPAGWYVTAEGRHERYWDGETWSAPRLKVTHVITHPRPDSVTEKLHLPVNPYRDLPGYATVPPFVPSTESFHAAMQAGGLDHRHRDAFSGTGFAWLAALWPALVTMALLVADATDQMSIGPHIIWGGLAGWMIASIADTRIVRSRSKGTDGLNRVSWQCGLIPPIELMARTRLTGSTRLIPMVLLIAVAFPVVWFMPIEWVNAVAGTISALTDGATAGAQQAIETIGQAFSSTS